MIWIIGSAVLVLWGVVVMCAIITAGRTDHRMSNNDWIALDKRVESYDREDP